MNENQQVFILRVDVVSTHEIEPRTMAETLARVLESYPGIFAAKVEVMGERPYDTNGLDT